MEDISCRLVAWLEIGASRFERAGLCRPTPVVRGYMKYTTPYIADAPEPSAFI